MTTPTSNNGFSISFHCEHTPTRSRVFALVATEGARPTLHAILTCKEPTVGELAARALGDAATSGTGRNVDAFIESVSRQLPDAPAASFRQAAENARTLAWPVENARSVSHEAVRNGYGYEQRDDMPVTPAGRDSWLRIGDRPRLADLTGPVVQVLSYQEVHVHDVPRLLAAARAQGWQPDDDSDLDASVLALDALMYLTGDTDQPGTDFLAGGSEGQILDMRRGDEVSSWNKRPLTANFGRGWLVSEADLNPEISDTEALGSTRGVGLVSEPEITPNFDTLFEPCRCGGDECGRCAGFQLTPRTAHVLWSVAQVLADQAYDDVERNGDDPVEPGTDWALFDRYPRITFSQDAVWRRQAARSYDDLTADLASGQWPQPTCPAEEMALHLMLEYGPVAIDDAWWGRAEDLSNADPHPNDFDWDMAGEVFVQDTDILNLFDASLDGIDDPDSDANRFVGIGDYRPSAWFHPFLNMPRRDGRRPFRR